MTLKLYIDYLSQPCRGLVLFCRAANIPHEVVHWSLFKGEHKSELNPFQTLPWATHNGILLNESMAILRYITKVFDVEDHWYPKVKILIRILYSPDSVTNYTTKILKNVDFIFSP